MRYDEIYIKCPVCNRTVSAAHLKQHIGQMIRYENITNNKKHSIWKTTNSMK